MARIHYTCTCSSYCSWGSNNSLSQSVCQSVDQSMSDNLVFGGNFTGRVFHERGNIFLTIVSEQNGCQSNELIFCIWS